MVVYFTSVGPKGNTFWFQTLRIKQEIIAYEREMLTIDWGTVTCEEWKTHPQITEKPISVCHITESNESGMSAVLTHLEIPRLHNRSSHVARTGLLSPWSRAASEQHFKGLRPDTAESNHLTDLATKKWMPTKGIQFLSSWSPCGIKGKQTC